MTGAVTPVAQPQSPVLYLGYVLALVAVVTCLLWTLRGQRSRLPAHRLGFVAGAVASIALTVALRSTLARRQRPARRHLPARRPPSHRRSRGTRRTVQVSTSAAVAMTLVVLGGIESSASAATPGRLTVQTVPALTGVHLVVGTTRVTTDRHGRGELKLSDLSGVASRVRLADSALGAGDSVAISKVVSLPHAAHEARLAVGLDITSRVRLHLDAGRTRVPVSQVTSVRLHSVVGRVLTVDPRSGPVLHLLSRRTRLTGGTLTTQRVTWSVDRVLAQPGVALAAAVPRFDPFHQGTWELSLQPVAGALVIDTVPKTGGVEFLLDGGSVTTGSDGRVVAPVADLNDVSRRLQLGSKEAGALSVSLLRVSKLPPGAPHQRRVVVALSVRRPVSLHFVDTKGTAVDAERISEVVLEGGGRSERLSGAQIGTPVSLLVDVPKEVHGSWRARPVSYSIASVTVDGANAVFTGRQRFSAARATSWPISLSVFQVTLTAHDVLFGSRITSHALITKPDGSAEALRFDSSTKTVVPSLVRGLYDVKVDAAVLGAHTKVLVSRDDSVDVRVVTLLDAAVVAALLLAIALGAALLGRSLARRPAQPADPPVR